MVVQISDLKSNCIIGNKQIYKLKGPHNMITLLLMLAATIQSIVIVDIDTKKNKYFFTNKTDDAVFLKHSSVYR